jgi:hypothetical protein
MTSKGDIVENPSLAAVTAPPGYGYGYPGSYYGAHPYFIDTGRFFSGRTSMAASIMNTSTMEASAMGAAQLGH